MFAGRCASCSHMAMSSTRVQGTGSVMGHAAGTAAAIAVKNSITPKQVGVLKIKELQQTLFNDDCYLPWIRQEFSELTKSARVKASSGNPSPLRDGISRPIKNNNHRWDCKAGDKVEFLFNKNSFVKDLAIIFDSALSRRIQMSHHYKFDELKSPPPELVKEFCIDALLGRKWKRIYRTKDNYQRFVKIPLNKKVKGLRLTIDKTWGNKTTAISAMYV